MKAFGDNSITIRDEENWDEAEEVVIRPLTWGERKAMLTLITKGKKSVKEEDIGLEDGKQVSIFQLEKSIVSWTFCNGDGDIAELSSANINKLPEIYTSFILEQINALTPDRGDDEDDEDAEFLGASGDSRDEG
jgi:hypothetical protein